MNWNILFSYDRSTGHLTWKERPVEHFKTATAHKIWNARFPGMVAGHKQVYRAGMHKSIEVQLSGLAHKAHRIIWEMENGPIPNGYVIDHINGDPFDNRLENIRLCSSVENGRNYRKPRHNKSGFKGVSWFANTSSWHAQIKVSGKSIHLGSYDTKEAAHEAYCAAALRYHGEFARTK